MRTGIEYQPYVELNPALEAGFFFFLARLTS